MALVQDNGTPRFPVHHVNLDEVVLSDSPLDDYQRLYFGSLGSDEGEGHYKTKIATYKSNIAESFANPLKVSEETVRHQAKQSVLNCFEYQLPDVLTSKETAATEFEKLSATRRKNLQLDRYPQQVLKAVVIKDGDASNEDVHVVDPEDVSATLTKNQQFKMRKLDHNLHNNDKLINPNNCILWTRDSGYVFLTGIWRLYQDVMRGLIHVPRTGQEEHDHSLQDSCLRSLGMIIDYALYENPKDVTSPTSSTGFSDRRRRRSSLANETNFATPPSSNSNGQSQTHPPFSAQSQPLAQTQLPPQSQSGDSSGSAGHPVSAGGSGNAGSFSTAYTDLHWNNLVRDLKSQMLEMYKDYLIDEKGLGRNEVEDLSITDIIKRIRGGYIKIQGTWLPLEIAKLLCARFCFPIRYLLVPIFGEQFPEECETMFNNIHKQVGSNLTTINQTSYLSPNPWMDVNSSVMSPINQYAFMPTQKRKKKNDYAAERKKLLPNYVAVPEVKHFVNKSPSPSFSRRNSTMSWGPESSHFMMRKCSNENLPPISTIMDTLSQQILPVPVNDSYNYNQSQYQYQTPHNVSINGSTFTPHQQVFSEPTVQTLSHLATFYTTNGHRYSYPGNVYLSNQKQSPIMENFSNDYFAPKSNQASYAPTHDYSAWNNIYSTERSAEYWLPKTNNDYSKVQNSQRNESVKYPATNQGPFSESR